MSKVSKRVEEGLVTIDVFDGVFYNPRAELNRSMTILFLKSLGRDDLVVVDGLAATGVRGIRYLVETGNVSHVIFNDRSWLAYSNIHHNLQLNGLSVNSEVYRDDVSRLLYSFGEGYVDVVDIDPYGTPLPYISAGIYSLGGRGYLILTATDLMTLCGVVDDAVSRIYSSHYIRHDFCHETAIRILIKEAVLAASRQGFYAEPVYATFENHYIRVCLRMDRRRGELSLDKLGYLVRRGDGWVVISFKEVGENGLAGNGFIGPLWIAPYLDEAILDRMIGYSEEMPYQSTLRKFLSRLIQEDTSLAIIYRLSTVCRHLKVPMPSIKKVVSELKNMGYRASRTYLYPDGVRTDAPADVLYRIVNELSSVSKT